MHIDNVIFLSLSKFAYTKFYVGPHIYGLELHTFFGVCDTDAFAAPVQNLSMLENLPVRCSIGVFLVGLYLFRWMALFAFAMLTMLISSYMKRLETACIATCGAILLPSVLYLFMGLEPLKYLSLVLPVQVMPLLTESSNGNVVFFVVCMLMITLLGVCGYGIRRKMKVTGKPSTKN